MRPHRADPRGCVLKAVSSQKEGRHSLSPPSSTVALRPDVERSLAEFVPKITALQKKEHENQLRIN